MNNPPANMSAGDNTSQGVSSKCLMLASIFLKVMSLNPKVSIASTVNDNIFSANKNKYFDSKANVYTYAY